LEKYQDLDGVASPSSLIHGGARLDSFHYYAELSTKICEAGVYDSARARDLPCARGPCVPCACRRIRGVLHGVLLSGILYVIALVPPLIVTVLGPRTAPSDPLGGPAYSGLHDSM
jgi:hypothetical protein